jgi:hypothetical protein
MIPLRLKAGESRQTQDARLVIDKLIVTFNVRQQNMWRVARADGRVYPGKLYRWVFKKPGLFIGHKNRFAASKTNQNGDAGEKEAVTDAQGEIIQYVIKPSSTRANQSIAASSAQRSRRDPLLPYHRQRTDTRVSEPDRESPNESHVFCGAQARSLH